MKEGWEYKKLGEIAIDMYRGAGIRREQITASGYPCIRYGEIYTTYNIAFENCISHTVEDNISPRKYFEYGDLLFAITGESVEDIGKTIAYLGHEKCLLGGDIVCMKHNENPKYLSYALSTREAIRQKGLGKTKLKVVHTNIPSLKEIIIPIPPLSEQQSIVVYLDSAFAKIDAMKANAEKALNEAKALFQASLKEMLEPKEGWEKDKLINVYNFIDYRGATPNKLTCGVPLVTAKNVKYGYIDYTIKDYISEEEYMQRQSRGISRKGDLLFTTEAPLGNVAIADLDRFSAGQRLITLQQYKNSKYKIDNRFYYYYMMGPLFQKTIRILATGATALGIKAKLLKDVEVPITTYIDQQSIVATLDSIKSKVDQLQSNFDKISQECDALKQAILRQVFE